MGPYLVHRNILRQLAENFSPHVHGLRDEDINRRDMQNWTACQRIAFPKVRECLWKMARGLDGVPQNEQALGLWVYLDIIYDYVEMFVSLKASYYQRIINAGYVVTFLGIWRNHVIRSRGLTLSKNFLSRETFQDLLLSCHFVVILIADFSLHFPYLECPLDRTGEDGCEVFFSLNGSWVQNHHAYTILDMVRNHSSITRIAEINSTNPKLKLRKSNSKQDNIWDKQYEPGNRAKTYVILKDTQQKKKLSMLGERESRKHIVWQDSLAQIDLPMILMMITAMMMTTAARLSGLTNHTRTSPSPTGRKYDNRSRN